MPIFDYKGVKDTQLIKDVATIGYINLGALTIPGYTFKETNGWKVLDGKALNYAGKANPQGAFYGESPLESSAECNVLGQYDASGKLVKIGIAFWGTGTYLNAPDFALNMVKDAVSDGLSAIVPDYADNYVLKAHKNLMSSVAEFATANGLTGDDIFFTGHSLGGLAVNSMATLSARGEWGSFYESSKYVALASPTQNLADDKVINVGFENDPVFRALTGHTFSLDSLFKHDKPLETCTNNLVTFNDYHAGLTKYPQLFSIANLAAWAGHDGQGYIDGALNIMNSEIYDFTHQNSNIIVSNLSEGNRSTTWVSDLNKSITHVGSTFIVGTETNDLLKGGQHNDYLCGGGGDDSFKDNSGYNVIYGGAGTNTYVTECNVADFTLSRDTVGTLYFKYSTGDITRAEDIQYVNADQTWFKLLGINIKQNATWQVMDDGIKSGNDTIAYAKSFYANTENSFTVSTPSNDSWFYSGANDSNINVVGNNNNVVSGHANDAIHLNGKGNTLLFYGDFGHDTIYNLSTSDKLLFMGNKSIADNDSYLNHLSFEGDNALLTYGTSKVTLVGVNSDMLSQMHIAVA